MKNEQSTRDNISALAFHIGATAGNLSNVLQDPDLIIFFRERSVTENELKNLLDALKRVAQAFYY